MGLAVGTRFGRYEVVAPLGAGGMGEVYRARDTSLGRDVALKVQSADRMTDPAARVRFEREIATVAKLTSPGICTLYDAGIDGQHLFFVMELVTGDTLAQRLARAGRTELPIDEAIDIASDLCEALAYAHQHGVVHRDVKPANVMLTARGVKLLDFGVAHIIEPEGGADAATITAAAGMIGTLAYMAPEQLDGRADPRSDLFAVGAVLYEMLTGQRAFPGNTSSDVIGALARCAPTPLSEVRPGVPAALMRVVHRCLRKDPGQRWQSAADLAEALRLVRQPGMAQPTPPSRGWRRSVLAVCSVAAAVTAAVAAGVQWGRESTPPPNVAFYLDDLTVPDGTVLRGGQSAWSRDGRRVAIVTQPAVGERIDPRIWTMEVGVDTAWRLIDGGGPEIALYPTWSPDGRSLAYFRDRTLVRVSLTSASLSPVPLADAPSGRGAAWLDDGTIVYAPDPQGDLWRVSAQGGAPSVLIRRGEGEIGVKFPAAVGGDRFLYWAQRPTQNLSEVRIASASRPEAGHLIVQSSNAAAYASGRVFYMQDRVLVGRPVDSSWALTGEAVPIVADFAGQGNIGAPIISGGGTTIGVESRRPATFDLSWVDRSGALLGTIGTADTFGDVAISPDGRRLLAKRFEPGMNGAAIVLVDLETGTGRRVLSQPGANAPTWHPTEPRLAFRALLGPGGNSSIYEQGLDDTRHRPLVEVLSASLPVGWLASGEFVWTGTRPGGLLNGVFARDAAGADRPLRVAPDGLNLYQAAIRPGDAGLAYVYDESGRFEVYAEPLPPGGAPWRISRGGGDQPKWSRDGRELFFLSDGAVHVVPMTGPGGGPSGPPRRLFAVDGPDYDVHPDGRLLVLRPRRDAMPYLRLLHHWQPDAAARR